MQDFWNKLNSRDRKALIGLCAALVLYVAYSLHSGLANNTERAERQAAALANQLVEMRELSAKVLAKKGAVNRGGSLPSQLNRIAKVHAVRYASLQPVDGGARVSLSNVTQSSLMSWLEGMAREGYSLNELTIAPGQSGTLSLSATIIE